LQQENIGTHTRSGGQTECPAAKLQLCASWIYGYVWTSVS